MSRKIKYLYCECESESVVVVDWCTRECVYYMVDTNKYENVVVWKNMNNIVECAFSRFLTIEFLFTLKPDMSFG